MPSRQETPPQEKRANPPEEQGHAADPRNGLNLHYLLATHQEGDTNPVTGARYPAGTRARVVQAFAGGALVEVLAADGDAERFEVPDAAFEPAGAGTGVAEPPTEATTPSTAGESWSPAMPAPATEDWGFDESGGREAAGGAATTPSA